MVTGFLCRIVVNKALRFSRSLQLECYPLKETRWSRKRNFVLRRLT